MRNYQVFMPAGKRVYDVQMPTNKRVYNVQLPSLVTCQSGAPNLIPNPTDLTGWFGGAGITVTGNAAISPSGQMDADQVEFTSDANTLFTQINGLIGASFLDTQVWMKVLAVTGSPVLEFLNFTDDFRGRWEIDLTHASLSNWQLVRRDHPSVDIDTIWAVQSNGNLDPGFALTAPGVTATVLIWCVDMRYF